MSRFASKWAFLAGGYSLFALGAAGLLLPLLPTTIFWIGAAWCFAKSSPSMYRRILSWPRIGRAVHDFLAYGMIERSGKIAALTAMAACAVIVVFAAYGSWILPAAMGGIGIGAAYVLSRPSAPTADKLPYRRHGAGAECPFLAHMAETFPPAPRFFS